MKFPKRTRYRKNQKNLSIKKITNKSSPLRALSFKFGLKSTESRRLHPKTIEACRRIYARKFRRKAKIRINTFPDIPVTRKSTESRMGKGKGSVQFWLCPLKGGQTFFQIKKVSKIPAKQVSKTLTYKIPMNVKFVSKSIVECSKEYKKLPRPKKNFPILRKIDPLN